MNALERLKRLRRALAERDWLGITIEVLVVTVGVLIAIVAEQLVERGRWRSEVREFRRAVDRDIAFSLAGYQVRLQQNRCIERRISELTRWRDSLREGRKLQIVGEIGHIISPGMPTSAWASRSSELMRHIPYETRRDYGSVNDSLANYFLLLSAEREVWRSLQAFNGATQLSADNLLRLNELIYRARTSQRLINANFPRLLATSGKLHISPSFENDPVMKGIKEDPNQTLCTPILRERLALQ